MASGDSDTPSTSLRALCRRKRLRRLGLVDASQRSLPSLDRNSPFCVQFPHASFVYVLEGDRHGNTRHHALHRGVRSLTVSQNCGLYDAQVTDMLHIPSRDVV